MQITDTELAIIKGILRQEIPNLTVWAYGSRVKGTAKCYSDLDLAIISSEPLSFLQLARLEQAFSVSPLTWKVDLLDWATTSDCFKKIIQQQYEIVQ